VRVTYIHQYFTTPEQGGGTRSYEMGRRLVKMGHQVRMITTSRESGFGGGRSALWRASRFTSWAFPTRTTWAMSVGSSRFCTSPSWPHSESRDYRPT